MYLRIIVLGYIIRGPLGGMVTSNLQYLMGLADLGHDVYFLEDSDCYESCYNPITQTMGKDPSFGLHFAHDVFTKINFAERWSYFDEHTSQWFGPCSDRIINICKSADLLLNLCGINPIRPWLEEIPLRVLIDQDPVFTQIKNLTNRNALERSNKHNKFFTFGENFGTLQSKIPDDGFPWQPTRPPIFLNQWPVLPLQASLKYTTVMQWRSYKSIEYNHIYYGMKNDSFIKFIDLPSKIDSSSIFELAISGLLDKDFNILAKSGWKILNPAKLSLTPWTYQQYIQQSKVEFSVAKHGYVISNSGWFSERSACYLASGRPVILQDTGFSSIFPVGEGILCFTNLEEAIASIQEVDNNYTHQ